MGWWCRVLRLAGGNGGWSGGWRMNRTDSDPSAVSGSYADYTVPVPVLDSGTGIGIESGFGFGFGSG